MSSNIWLNIGCGKKHIEGFINMDIVQPYDEKLDATKGLPFEDAVVSGVYSEHFFEHLTQSEGLNFLRECRRVLVPGGLVRVAMPDLDEIIQRYISQDWRGGGDMFNLGFDWVINRCEMMNLAMREWGHKHVYNQEELERIARLSGLEPIRRYEFGQSDTKEFLDKETRNSSKLIMEFRKPNTEVPETLPVVSVLIPAYRSTYLKEAIESVLSQIYQNLEIIVADDCADNSVEKVVSFFNGKSNKIKYIKNIPALGGLNNYLFLMTQAQGEYIKFLNDDDILFPECISKMVDIFSIKPQLTLVTSKRKRIDSHGHELPDVPATMSLCNEDVEIEGNSCANALLGLQANFIGEPSTVLFRKRNLDWVLPNFMSFGGSIAYGAGDVAMWLNLLSQGNAYVFNRPLSAFRIHELQRQNDPEVNKKGSETWGRLLFQGARLGLVKSRLPLSIKTRRGNSKWRYTCLLLHPMFLTQLKILMANVIHKILKK